MVAAVEWHPLRNNVIIHIHTHSRTHIDDSDVSAVATEIILAFEILKMNRSKMLKTNQSTAHALRIRERAPMDNGLNARARELFN